MNTNLFGIFTQRLTHAYSRKVHQSTGMTPFRLSIARKPSGFTLKNLSITLLRVASQPILVKLPRLHSLHRLSLMSTKSDRTLKETQMQYKKLDQSVRNLLTLRSGDYVNVDRPPTMKTAAIRMADEPRLNLLPKSIGPFRITYTMEHKITTNEDAILNVISINRVMPTLRPNIAHPFEQSTSHGQWDTSTTEVTKI